MGNKKRNFLISGILIVLAILFTVLVKVVDVQALGANGSSIGFATVNQFVFEKFGVNPLWYDITDILGLVAIASVMIYGLTGLVQLIKRKSLLKVDKELFVLAGFYVAVVALYVFFEMFIINYRPVLMEGVLEASYPSSHTLLTVCLCGSSIIINKKLFNNKITKIINVLLAGIMVTTVVGRLVSGVHWFTDIIGGVIISSALLMTFYSIIYSLKESKK